MTYRIGICDDNKTDAAYMEKLLLEWADTKQQQIKCEVFPSAESFLFRYAEDKDYDILLLDIEMGEMDGVALAKKLREENDSVQIIFTTGYADYMAEGYEVAALHYLMKPVSEEKLFTVLDRAAAAIEKTEQAVLLPVDGEVLKISPGDVQYVEAFAHSVVVHMENQQWEVRLSISEMEQRLTKEFIRCHRSYLVNLKYISRIGKKEVILDNGTAIPLARTAGNTVNQAFITYCGGNEDETVWSDLRASHRQANRRLSKRADHQAL